jgi:hypothetical protein
MTFQQVGGRVAGRCGPVARRALEKFFRQQAFANIDDKSVENYR